METNQIKKFAQEARKVLLKGVKHKLALLGFDTNGNVSEKDMPVAGEDHVVFMGRVITDMSFYGKWTALYTRMKEKGLKEVVEEAAYTWFNRLVAVRIMVKNGFADPVLEYQSEQIRVPRIVADVRRGIYPKLTEADRTQLMTLLEDDSKTTEQFTLLIVNYCRFNPVLSACFGGINDYTELLLPANILAEGGFVDLLNHTGFITDDDFRQSELIGWLYQFYISEKKDEVFASFKNKKKAEADDIPAATQIFTPNWIVKYMVQNTVGRIYLDNNPYATDIREQMRYLVEPAEPMPDSAVLRYDDLHNLTVADLGCGSGHILNEAFDLLYAIYVDEGYNRRRAIEDIFRYNITGVDLDTRAKQLAMFALLMKACQRDESFLDAHCLPHVLDMSICAKVRRLNAGGGVATLLAEFFAGAGKTMMEETLDALRLMEQADNLGSIMKFGISDATRTAIVLRSREWREHGTVSEDMQTLLAAFDVILALTEKYAALVMNPPYMGAGNMNAALSDYVKKNYPDGKADLFSVFMLLAKDKMMPNGKYGMINMQSWMFLSSFENLRKSVLEQSHIDNMLHLGPRTFDELSGEVVQNVAFVISNTMPYGSGVYYRLVDGKNCSDKERMFLNGENVYPGVSQQNFEKIPGSPIGYWVSEKMIEAFSSTKLRDYGDARSGIMSGNTNLFIRNWHEISLDNIGFNLTESSQIRKCKKQWYPIVSGGEMRKWYGNLSDVINLRNDGEDIIAFSKNYRLREPKYYFKQSITWPKICSGITTFRLCQVGILFGDSGLNIFIDNNIEYYLGLLNSNVLRFILRIINPTLNNQVSDIANLPVIKANNELCIKSLVQQNITISKQDWDAHETSWDFEENPLLSYVNKDIKEGDTGKSYRIEALYNLYTADWEERFEQLHANEEELNRQFIEIYDLQDELTLDVPLDEITILQQGEISIKNEE